MDSTHWSLVLAAGKRTSAESESALETLCATYWLPLYSYVRAQVGDVHAAQDLTQEFFAQLLEKNYLADADPERGRFRAFLLTALKHFLSNERDRARARKRGGGRTLLSLDFEQGERRYRLEPLDQLTPEKRYQRQWAVTLTDRALLLLRAEYTAARKGELFDVLKTYLTGAESKLSYGEAASRLAMSEGAARVAVHRLRRRYGEVLRSEIAQTVHRPEDVDEEIRDLFAALSRFY